MNKNYIKNNLFNSTTKFAYIFLGIYLLGLYIRYITTFCEEIAKRGYIIEELNVYGLILNTFSTPIQVSLVLLLIFLISQYNIISNSYFKLNIISKFDSKKEWVRNDFISIILSAFMYVIFIVIFYGLIGIANLNCENKWTDGNQLTIMPGIVDSIYQVGEGFSQISPFIAVILNCIIIALFFIAFGLVLRILKIILDNNAVIFAITLCLSFCETYVYSFLGIIPAKISIGTNITMFNENWNNNIYLNSAGKIFYWLIIIGVLYFILNKLIIKIDMKFKENK